MKTEGWQKRFREELTRYSKATFVWGEFDCVVFAYQIAGAVTGKPIGVEVHMRFGGWKSCRQAFRAHRGKLGEATSTILGEQVAPQMLSMGDIGLAEIDGQEALVVCDGTKFFGPAKESGLQEVPREFVKYGWIL